MSPAAGVSCLRLQSTELTAPPQKGEPERRVERGRTTCGERRSGGGRSPAPTLAVELQSCPGPPLMTTLHQTTPSTEEKLKLSTVKCVI